MNLVKSRLLGKNTLSSIIIGVVPQEAAENEVSCFCGDSRRLKNFCPQSQSFHWPVC
jgi:hypothetical protein